MTQSFTAYMCRIDFEVERGEPSDGNKVYASMESLIREHDCALDCGIVEVEITLKRIAVEGNGP